MTETRSTDKKITFLLIGIFTLVLWIMTSNNTYETGFQKIIPDFNIVISLENQFIFIIGVILPFLMAGGLLLLILIKYSNMIKSSYIRKGIKITTFLLILFGLYLLSTPMLEEIYGEEEEQGDTTTTATMTTSGFTNSTGTGSNSETTSTTTTTTTSTTPSVPVTRVGDAPEILVKITELLANYFVFVFVAIFFVLLFVLRMKPRTPIQDVRKRGKKAIDRIYRHERDKPRKHIIARYLEASALLEQMGADRDYSLTPKEFENDVKTRFTEDFWSKFPELTDWYEVARFSNEQIPDSIIQVIDEEMERIYQYMESFYEKKKNKKNSKSMEDL